MLDFMEINGSTLGMGTTTQCQVGTSNQGSTGVTLWCFFQICTSQLKILFQ